MAVLETAVAAPLGDEVTSSAQPVWTIDGIDYLKTVHQDKSVPGFKTKHIYYSSDSREKFRIRYDRIVSFEPYEDGFGIMREGPDRETPELGHRGRLVRLQPGHQLGPDVIILPVYCG